jgi:hypothetical protein
MLTILNHIGLGDHLVLNGLVRHFAEIEESVTIFAKGSHVPSVKFMYRDISEKVNIITVSNSCTTAEMMQHARGRVLKLGVHATPHNLFEELVMGRFSDYTNWVCMMYIQAGLNPNTMYKKFKIIRDKSREFLPPDKPYVFVHDDAQRGRKINITTDKEIYRPSVSKVLPDGGYEFDDFNIFDYLTIIENARERHMMNSSYNWLVEIMSIGDKTTNFFHLNIGAHDYFPEKNTRSLCTSELWTVVNNSSPQ